MLIGGLWHGAAWTFVVWGMYHGLLLVAYRLGARWWNPLPAGVRQISMFFFVLIGWVFFRATSFGMAATLLQNMFLPVAGANVADPLLAAAVIAIAAWWGMRGPNAFDMNLEWTWGRRVALTVAAAASLAIIAGARPSPFLYFQF